MSYSHLSLTGAFSVIVKTGYETDGSFYSTNIRVRFSDGAGWEGWADFLPSDVHKQYGIAMKTPKYRDGNIKEKTKVFLELYKPSDESVSEPQDFFFLPPLSLLGPAQVAHPSVK